MKNYEKCDRVSAVLVGASVLLSVLAFWPGGLIPGGILKGYILILTILTAFAAWLIGRLIEGTFRIPWTPVSIGLLALVVSVLFSALFSDVPFLGFFGEAFEPGTFAMLGTLMLGLFLAMSLYTSRKYISQFLTAALLLYVVIAFFQLVHTFFPAFTTLGVFRNIADTPFGVLADLAFISGSVLIGSIFTLQFLHPAKKLKILLIAASILSLFFILLPNIFLVWVLVGASAIVILIYALYTNRTLENPRFPFLVFVLSLVALLFILANSLFGGFMANLFNITYIDVHPSVSASFSTSLASLRENPVFGAGPNTFLHEWLVHRPVSINTNIFWDVPFTTTLSFFGTVAVLGGAVGILGVLIFLGIALYESFRKVFRVERMENMAPLENSGPTILTFGAYILILYYMCALIFSSPGVTVIVPGIIFFGVFLGMLVGQGRIRVRTISFLKEQRAGFFAILGIVILLILSAGTIYAATERFASIVLFEKSTRSAEAGDIGKADSEVRRAITLVDMPIYERTRLLFAAKAIENAAKRVSSSPSDAVHTEVQNAVTIGNTAGRRAIALAPRDPSNYIAYGDFLRGLVPFKIEGALAGSADAYQRAIDIAPEYPKPYLLMARLYLDAGDSASARLYTNRALGKKVNYTDAYFLLEKMEIATGNTKGAIEYIQEAARFDPNNPDVHFELGLLRYNALDYVNAVNAFKNAVSLNKEYMNAWYYLALSLERIGNTDEATDILNRLHVLFPENQDVNRALSSVSSASAPEETGNTSKKP